MISLLNAEFKLRKLNPQRIFAMADNNRTNQVKFQVCLQALGKVVSDFSPAFLNEIPVALEISPDDLVTK